MIALLIFLILLFVALSVVTSKWFLIGLLIVAAIYFWGR